MQVPSAPEMSQQNCNPACKHSSAKVWLLISQHKNDSSHLNVNYLNCKHNIIGMKTVTSFQPSQPQRTIFPPGVSQPRSCAAWRHLCRALLLTVPGHTVHMLTAGLLHTRSSVWLIFPPCLGLQSQHPACYIAMTHSFDVTIECEWTVFSCIKFHPGSAATWQLRLTKLQSLCAHDTHQSATWTHSSACVMAENYVFSPASPVIASAFAVPYCPPRSGVERSPTAHLMPVGEYDMACQAVWHCIHGCICVLTGI